MLADLEDTLNILGTGAGGVIGHHLLKRLKKDGHRVIGCDWKFPEFDPAAADTFSMLMFRREDIFSTSPVLRPHGRGSRRAQGDEKGREHIEPVDR